MDSNNAEALIGRLRSGKPASADSLQPIVATMLAAETLRGGRDEWTGLVELEAVKLDADTVRLANVFGGSYELPKRGGMAGRTYSPLVKLATHAEVDYCNEIISDLFHEQLHSISPQYVMKLSKIVGELHDNVASHANGAGFSAAQVYDRGSSKEVSFAIADAGCGMLSNVQKAVSAITDDIEAIEWCLIRGNTSAAPLSPFAQRLPENDPFSSPFGDSTDTYTVENHHIGEGLWQLCELIGAANGSAWIKSGSGAVLRQGGSQSRIDANGDWSGVAIEVQLMVSKGATFSEWREQEISELAERLGL